MTPNKTKTEEQTRREGISKVPFGEKRWYVVNGLHYFGPYEKEEHAKQERKAKLSVNGCPCGRVVLLDPNGDRPDFGLHGSLKPNYG